MRNLKYLGLALVMLAGMLFLLFPHSFNWSDHYILFSNDGPLGSCVSEWVTSQYQINSLGDYYTICLIGLFFAGMLFTIVEDIYYSPKYTPEVVKELTSEQQVRLVWGRNIAFGIVSFCFFLSVVIPYKYCQYGWWN